MTTTKISWTFPDKRFVFLRIEGLSIALIGILIFLFSWINMGSFIQALIFTAVFLGLYLVLSYLTQLIRIVEEKYHLSPTHFEVTRRTRFKIKTEKVPLKKIKHHKLDVFFRGGYLLSNQGKHLLFFNSKKEVDKFKKHIKKHVKS